MTMIIEIHHYHHSGDRPQQPADDQRLQTLEEKVKQIMSQVDDLTNELNGVKGDLDVIKTYVANQADKITALAQQLETLQQTTPPQVDLSGVVAAAQDIKSEADAIVASFGGGSTASTSDGSAGTGTVDAGAGSGTATGDTGGVPTTGGASDAGGSTDAGSTAGSTDAGASTGTSDTASAGAGAASSGGDAAATQPDTQP